MMMIGLLDVFECGLAHRDDIEVELTGRCKIDRLHR